MVPPPSQESFTFTVGKLGEIPSQRDTELLLILSALDAGMAVGPKAFMEVDQTELRSSPIDPPRRTSPPHRVSIAIAASWCDRRVNRQHCRPPESRRREEAG